LRETQSGREYSKRNGAAVPEAERLSGARGILKMTRETRQGFRKVPLPFPLRSLKFALSALTIGRR
jgi:hypothetical protein